MSNQPQTGPTPPPASLRFERRSADRWPTTGRGTAISLSGRQFGQIHDLTLVDTSHGGLAARCDRPLEPGTTVSMGFDRPGALARRGVVRRCTPCGHGYRVAIQYELGLAA